MLVNKYSMFSRNLYAAAGATIYLIAYRGTVALVKDEDGNTFSALSTEVYFGKELITVQQSQPYENPAPAGKTRKGGRKAVIDESPTLF